MTDFSGDATVGGATGASRPDSDRQWWSEPDPVELFAAGLELALRQLRVEVAGLRAERDGLRLEVEGLRAKLVIAQEQLSQRDNLGDTVRQLQAAVARLTLGQAGFEVPVAPETPVISPVVSPVVLPSAGPVLVLPTILEPFAVEPIVVPSIPDEPIVLVSIPVESPAAAPAEPSAIDQLKAMGLWPLRPSVEPSAPPPPEPAPAYLRETPRSPSPEPEAAPAAAPEHEGVVHWDRASTRRTPVVTDGAPGFDDLADDDAASPRRKGPIRRALTGVMVLVGALVVLTVLLVSVGPRVLPYQTYFVRSGSMEPTIQTGAMVVLTKVDGSTLEPGDIITFKNPNDETVLVTHRIVEIENNEQGRVFITKGDANSDPDSWRVPASGAGWKYAFNIPLIGFVFGYLGTPQARLALLVIPAAVLGLLALLDIWRPKADEA